jgi:hypothetical protein
VGSQKTTTGSSSSTPAYDTKTDNVYADNLNKTKAELKAEADARAAETKRLADERAAQEQATIRERDA